MYTKRIASCSERLNSALEMKGMKQAELCKLANVPKSSLSLYLSGAYEPKQDRVYDMAKALNVSEAWLMGYDVPMERKPKNNSPEEQKLTEGEMLLIELFRQIPEEQQRHFLEIGRAFANSLKKE